MMDGEKKREMKKIYALIISVNCKQERQCPASVFCPVILKSLWIRNSLLHLVQL